MPLTAGRRVPTWSDSPTFPTRESVTLGCRVSGTTTWCLQIGVSLLLDTRSSLVG